MADAITQTSIIVSDYDKAIEFMEEPRHEDYGKVVVFKDIFGNKWDLVGKR